MTVSPEVQLEIYNNALGHLGSGALASLSEARKSRRVMDRVWGTGDAVAKYALGRGEWNWALRTIEADYVPSIEPGFGFRRAFTKPDDFARLAGLSGDGYMTIPLTDAQYKDEASYWFADLDVIFVRYVSTDDGYGMDSSKWSPSFKKFIEFHMAWEGCEEITNSTAKRDRLKADRDAMLKEAKSADAMNEGSKQLPHGSWSRSRGRSGSNWW